MDHPRTGATAVLVDPGSGPDGSGDGPDGPGDGPRVERGLTAGGSSSARSPHRLAVVTPEGVLLEFRAAGVGSRMLAIFIDVTIQFLAVVVLLFLAAFIVLGAGNTAAGIVVVVVAVFLIIYGYPAVSEAVWDGRTVGKALLGIRVITTEGAPVAFRHTAVRAMLTTVDFWLPTPGGLVALTSALTTKRSQRLGDLAAGTIVVRRVRARPSPVFFGPAHGAENFAQLIDTSALGPAQYAVIRDFVLRAPDLEPGRLGAIGDDLAARVARLTGTPRPPWLDSHRYLVSVLNAHQARFRPSAAASPPMSPMSPMSPMGPMSPMSPMGPGGPVLAELPPPVGPPVAGAGWNSR